ncbi:MAG: hypothetical protein J5947_02365, partial [Clostridium sp.]|nr:hypothetical protein [Clostridium sp.]
MNTRKKIVIALGGNALGNSLPEQMQAVKVTAKAIADLYEEGHEIVVVHGNGPRIGIQLDPPHADTVPGSSETSLDNIDYVVSGLFAL